MIHSAIRSLRFPFRGVLAALLALALVPTGHAEDGLRAREIDRLARRAMETFDVPGMAVGVVANGEVVYARGHGIRELGQPGEVDPDTLFKIASNSKAFTAAALAILVDEGRIAWDGHVADYIPEFRMSDPWVTAELSVTDLLAHRSGLVAHAGDLMLWPDPNRFTRDDVIRGLRHFPLVADFRDSYNYDNVLYIVAGEIIPRVTGQGWGAFVDERLLRPLGRRCFAGGVPADEMHNLAAPHGEIDGELRVIERSRIAAEPPLYAAAGGIVCSLSGMLEWARLQLERGITRDGHRLFSASRSREMWTPANSWRVSERQYEWHRTHFNGYGLGWRLADVHGFLEVSHTGSLAGMRAYTLLLPERDVGFVVLSNGSSSSARNAVMNTLKYAWLPVKSRDWVATYRALDELDEEAQATREAADAEAGEERPAVPPRALERYAGRYRDAWFGEASVTVTETGLAFAADKSPKLSGPLEHVTADTFVARWPDRSVGMDAWLHFEFDRHGALVRLRMNRVFDDPEATVDYFEYLDFSPVN